MKKITVKRQPGPDLSMSKRDFVIIIKDNNVAYMAHLERSEFTQLYDQVVCVMSQVRK